MKLLIPVAAGLEQVTKRQLFTLGYDKAPAENGRISLDGTWQDVARLNMFLRSGERVLLLLRSSKHSPLTNCTTTFTLSLGKNIYRRIRK